MGWFHTIVGGLSAGARRAKEAAEEAAEKMAQEEAAAQKLAEEKAEELKQALAKEAAEKLAEAKAAAKKLAEEAAEKLAAAKAAAAKKAKEAKEAADEAAEKTGNSFIHATNVASQAAVAAWTEGSSEAKDISTAVEKAGITIGTGFIKAATVVGTGIEDAGEDIEKGLVALGHYLSDHLCDIALGSALSTTFAALAADGEEEASVGQLAILAATNFVDRAALQTEADALAFIIANAVYEIPLVSKAISKADLESAITFLIMKACTDQPELVVGSGGQFIAGVLIAGITSVICEGKVPGGYKVWKGAQ